MDIQLQLVSQQIQQGETATLPSPSGGLNTPDKSQDWTQNIEWGWIYRWRETMYNQVDLYHKDFKKYSKNTLKNTLKKIGLYIWRTFLKDSCFPFTSHYQTFFVINLRSPVKYMILLQLQNSNEQNSNEMPRFLKKAEW